MILQRPQFPTTREKARWLGISRIIQPDTRTVGYLVRVKYFNGTDGIRRPGRVKYFGDHTHGSPEKALRAARRWRDEETARRGRRRTVTPRG